MKRITLLLVVLVIAVSAVAGVQKLQSNNRPLMRNLVVNQESSQIDVNELQAQFANQQLGVITSRPDGE